MKRFGRGEGVFGIYTAPVKDSKFAYVPKANRYLTDVAMVGSKTTVNSNTGFYNNAAKVTKVTEAESVLTVEGRDMPPYMVAMLLGKVYNEATGMIYDDGSQSEAPYCATSYHRVYETGVKFEQYLKGKWSVEGEESATQKEDIDPKNITLVYTAITTEFQWDLSQAGGTVYDFDSDAFILLPGGSKRYQKVITKSVSKDEYLLDPESWYSKVQVPAPATIPVLELSASSPSNLIEDVAVDVSVNITMSNPMANISFVLMGAVGGVAEGKLVMAEDAKSMTFTPNENLPYESPIVGVYDGVDIYGQRIQGSISFTTGTL